MSNWFARLAQAWNKMGTTRTARRDKGVDMSERRVYGESGGEVLRRVGDLELVVREWQLGVRLGLMEGVDPLPQDGFEVERLKQLKVLDEEVTEIWSTLNGRRSKAEVFLKTQEPGAVELFNAAFWLLTGEGGVAEVLRHWAEGYVVNRTRR